MDAEQCTIGGNTIFTFTYYEVWGYVLVIFTKHTGVNAVFMVTCDDLLRLRFVTSNKTSQFIDEFNKHVVEPVRIRNLTALKPKLFIGDCAEKVVTGCDADGYFLNDLAKLYSRSYNLYKYQGEITTGVTHEGGPSGG